MNEGTDPILYWIIGLGFAGGYWLVSFIMNKLKKGNSEWKSHEPLPPGRPMPQPPASSYSTAAAPPAQPEATLPHSEEEQRFARILGLKLPCSPSEVEEAYQAALSKYAPERLTNLSPDIQKLAEERRREITAAYEFFQARTSGQ